MLDLMAECMILLEEKNAAMKIWEMIFEGNKIFTTLDKIEMSKSGLFKKNFSEHFNFLTDYMKLARRLGRFELAMKKSQEALTIAYKLKKLSKVNEVRFFMETLVFIDTNKNVMTSFMHIA